MKLKAITWLMLSLASIGSGATSGAPTQPTARQLALTVSTPLGPDRLIPLRFEGTEAISSLFRFQLDVVVENVKPIKFEDLLGQPLLITLGIPGNAPRHFGGICSRISQGERGRTHTAYRLEVVPQFWLLTRRAGSRIFQDQTVPEIIRQILTEHGVSFEGNLGSSLARTYVVQYRESDFAFACRLMEEEGIFYFFKHGPEGHILVLEKTPAGHPQIGLTRPLLFQSMESARSPRGNIHDWNKSQELASGKYTLRDHHFQLPDPILEADSEIQKTVAAGQALHVLQLPSNAALEVYDYPGEYAQRFDGVDKGGKDQPQELQKVFEAAANTAQVRMEEVAAHSLYVSGSSSSAALVSGHKFTLQGHFDANGEYVLTSVQHSARSSQGLNSTLTYENSFTCIPAGLPFRPQRLTPRPVISGVQTATVVGPKGAEFFTDKFGRVKVQFHWDRDGQSDGSSSCWVRVGSLVGGSAPGQVHIPRIGDEVIVTFLEGDPDQPVIVGAILNPLPAAPAE